eukprot:g198.t1
MHKNVRCLGDCFEESLNGDFHNETLEFVHTMWTDDEVGFGCQGPLFRTARPTCLENCENISSCEDLQHHVADYSSGCAFECARSDASFEYLTQAWEYGPSAHGACEGTLRKTMRGLPEEFDECSDSALENCDDLFVAINDAYRGCAYSKFDTSNANVALDVWRRRCVDTLIVCLRGKTGLLVNSVSNVGTRETSCSRVACDPNPCENGGLCEQTAFSPFYSCSCGEAYWGARCEGTHTCALPQHVSNAPDGHVCVGRQGANSIYAYETCVVNCESGYVSNPAELACEPTGASRGNFSLSPSQSTIQCNPMRCEVPAVDNAAANGVCGGLTFLEHDSTCDVRCASGFQSIVSTPHGIAEVATAGPCEGRGANDEILSGESCVSECRDGYIASHRELQCRAAVAFECSSLCSRFPYFGITNEGSCHCGRFFRSGIPSTDDSRCRQRCVQSGENFPCGDENHFAIYESPSPDTDDRICTFTSEAVDGGSLTKRRYHAEMRFLLSNDPNDPVQRKTDDFLRLLALNDIRANVASILEQQNASVILMDFALRDVRLSPSSRGHGRFFSSTSQKMNFTVAFFVGVVVNPPNSNTFSAIDGSFASDLQSAWETGTSRLQMLSDPPPASYKTNLGCWQIGMSLELTGIDTESSLDIQTAFGSLCDPGDVSAGCCYSACSADATCLGVQWRSDGRCLFHRTLLGSSAVVPPKIIRDTTFHDGEERVTAVRLRYCTNCWLAGYKAAMSASVLSHHHETSKVECGRLCRERLTCAGAKFVAADASCTLYASVSEIHPSVRASDGAFGLFRDGLCEREEVMPLPCSLPSNIYPSCESTTATGASHTDLLPSTHSCRPICQAGFTPSVALYTCDHGVLRSNPPHAVVTCEPNPCSWDSSSDSGHCDEGPSVSSGTFCSVRCDDVSLRPNVETFECLNGEFYANSVVESNSSGAFECRRPCFPASTNVCAEGQEIKSGDSCTAICPSGFLPDYGRLVCDGGIFAPVSFQCVPVILVGRGTSEDFDQIFRTFESERLYALIFAQDGEHERRCIERCIVDQLHGTGLCQSVSVQSDDVSERVLCHLFTEPALSTKLDSDAERSATFNVGNAAVGLVSRQVAGPTSSLSDGDVVSCLRGFVALSTPTDYASEAGVACAFAQSLSDCYEFSCPDPQLAPCSIHLTCTSGATSYRESFGSTDTCVSNDCDAKWWAQCESCDGICNFIGDYASGEGHFECVAISGNIDATHCNFDPDELKVQGNYFETTCFDGMEIGEQCEVVCPHGHSVSGDGTLLCLPGGALEVETCAESCSTQGHMPGTHRCGATLRNGEYCQFECSPGYAPSGTGFVLCNDGVVVGSGQSCEYVDGCADIRNSLSGIVSDVGTHNCSDTLRFGQRCEASCAPGFEEAVAVNVVCENDGVLTVGGRCDAHPFRCDSNALLSRINRSYDISCASVDACVLLSCENEYRTVNATMPCIGGLISDTNLGSCVMIDVVDDNLDQNLCLRPMDWLVLAVPRANRSSAPEGCEASVSHGESCRFDCQDGFEFRIESSTVVIEEPVVECTNGQIRLSEPGTCFKVPCLSGDAVVDRTSILRVMGSSNAAVGIQNISCVENDGIQTDCVVSCDERHDLVASGGALECVRSSTDEALRILRDENDMSHYCVPKSCDMSALEVENLRDDNCGSTLSSGNSCDLECSFGFVSLNAVTCEYGVIATDVRCHNITNALENVDSVHVDSEKKQTAPNTMNLELSVRLRVATLSAFELVRLRNVALSTCTSIIKGSAFGRRCETSVVSVIENVDIENDPQQYSDVRILVHVIDESNIVATTVHDSFRAVFVARLLTKIEMDGWRGNVADASELSTWVELFDDVETSASADVDCTFDILGEHLGMSVSSIRLSLVLGPVTISSNMEFCAQQAGLAASTCRLDVPKISMSFLDSGSLRVDVTNAASAAGWTNPSFTGAFVADVMVVVDGMLAFSEDPSSLRDSRSDAPAAVGNDDSEVSESSNDEVWPILAVHAPVILYIQPKTRYRGEVVTIYGKNFGHTSPQDCTALRVLLGEATCAIENAGLSSLSEVGWRNDSMLTCRVESGVLSEEVPVIVTRQALESSDLIFFSYAGDHIPLDPTELNILLEDARSRNERMRIAITCAESGLFSVVDPGVRSVAQIFAGACVDDVVGMASLVSANVVEVFNVTAIDAACVNAADGTVICDTHGSLGARAIALGGNHFRREDGSSNIAFVSVNGIEQPFELVEDTIWTTVPEGVGSNRVIIVTDVDDYSDKSGRIAYQAPSVLSVKGCVDNPSDGTTSICDKEADIFLTVSGRNFGPLDSPVQVLVGGSLCRNTRHDENEPHEKLLCTLLPVSRAPGGWQPITVLSLNQASDPAPLLQYESCAPGTYLSESTDQCQDCEVGTFGPSKGLSACIRCEYGRFAPTVGLSECERCEVGKHSDSVGQTYCKACSEGTFMASRGNRFCEACMVGKYTTTPGATHCVDCEVGKFQSQQRSTQCTACLPGKYSDERGARRCDDCPRGMYCPGGTSAHPCIMGPRGGSFCTSRRLSEPHVCSRSMYCPDSTTQLPCGTTQICLEGEGYAPRRCLDPSARVRLGAETSCVCRAGYFGVAQNVTDKFLSAMDNTIDYDEDFLMRVYRSLWIESKEHFSLDAAMAAIDTTVATEVAYDMDDFDTNADGALDSLEIDNAIADLSLSSVFLQCYACRLGMECYNESLAVDGIFAHSVVASRGYWNNRDMFFEGKAREVWGLELNFHRCDAVVNVDGRWVTACGGGSNWSSYELLSTKRSGRGEESGGQSSHATASSPRQALRSPRRLVSRKSESHSEWEDDVRARVIDADESKILDHFYHRDPPEKPHMWVKLKILVCFFQLLVAHQELVRVPWPTSFLATMRSLRFFEFNLYTLPYVTCLLKYNFWSEYFLQILAPIVILSLLFGFAVVSNYLPKRAALSTGTATRYSLIVLFLTYQSVTRFAVTAVQCEELPDGRFYLAADYNVECYEDMHRTLLPLLYIVVLVYPIGVPLLFGALLWRAQKQKVLFNAFGPTDSRKRIIEVNANTRRRLGVLYFEYTSKTWWFEISLLAYRLFCITAYVVLSTTTTKMYIVAMLTCFFAFAFVAYLKPFRENGDGILTLITFVALMMVLSATFCAELSKNTLESEPSSTVGALLIMGALTPILAAIVLVLRIVSHNPVVSESLQIRCCCGSSSISASSRFADEDQWLAKRLTWFEERLDVAKFNSDCQRMGKKLARQIQQLGIQLAFVQKAFIGIDLKQALAKKATSPRSRLFRSSLVRDGTVLLCELIEETMRHVSSYASLVADLLSLNVARASVARLLFALAPWDDRFDFEGRGCWYWFDVMSDRIVEVTPKAIYDLTCALADVEALLWRFLHKKTGIETVRYRRLSSRRSFSRADSSTALVTKELVELDRDIDEAMQRGDEQEKEEDMETVGGEEKNAPESPRKRRRRSIAS